MGNMFFDLTSILYFNKSMGRLPYFLNYVGYWKGRCVGIKILQEGKVLNKKQLFLRKECVAKKIKPCYIGSVGGKCSRSTVSDKAMMLV
ncbi:MAG: hypothetical protein L3J57_15975 [Desulfuromusa sp.]|nr:hypothetical protein [Desulfuromusa sp.]